MARADARRRLRRLKAGTTVATVLGFAGSAVASPCSRGDSHKGHGDGGAPDPDAIGDFVRWLYQTRRL